MTLCSNCNKNPAVVFVNRIVDGKPHMEGLCLNCAREKGINPLESMMKQYGASDEDIENLNNQFNEIMDSVSEMDFPNEMTIDETGMPVDDADDNPFSTMMNSMSSMFSGFGNKGKEKNSNSKEQKSNEKNTSKSKNKKRKMLDTYGTNLTQKAKDGEIDKLIGREEEIERVTQILNRRSKNNPVLIGEPGVGKTAIAQGLALKIANQDVPAKLLKAEIYLIDMTSIVAGTQFRGQFEARLKALIEECKTSRNIILVIDEIHNIVGAGGDAEHTMNAANILKPALSNGDIQVIGTTTLSEYRKHIEKDAALERRFQPVIVKEPTIEQSIEILEGIKSYYEDYHHVKVSSNLIRQIVIMSEKYIHDRFLPDKAIDILDEACSKVNLTNKVLAQLEILREDLDVVQAEKAEAENVDDPNKTLDYEKIANLKTREATLLNQIAEISQGNVELELNIEDIANVIETWTKIPASKISETEAEKLLNLENSLHKRLIGQDKAVSAVSNAIRRSRAGLNNKKRPPSFIFVGPTGVGKTELAKSLAVELFGTEEAIIRIDMSEYMESHSVSKLIGSPPGYVGYDEAGQLTEKVRRNPYSLILFDEIEKAHSDVFNILLQVLDDGRLTDSTGRVVSFENTIIIMTSNAGSDLNNNGIGFNKDEEDKIEARVQNSLKQTFRPEFLNRVDETIVFKELTKKELLQIVDLMLSEIVSELAEKNIHITFSDEVKEYILEKGYEPKYGARPLRRAIQKYVENELAEYLLRNEIIANEEVTIILDNDKVAIK
ncbi:MAG: ATP-dependent Clp protease ATP-binding subunit [Clostridia bacterium]|nr:ATP-dependent Clp protease ATP-binding subunit [Clostridia bacterium]